MSEALMIIGHRGASGYAPENTLKSFAKAIELGVDMIEFDVHVCKSGELVVIHDKTLERTTNGTGSVADKTLDKLKKLDAGDGERIPTLQEVLNSINRRVKVDIELKGHNTAAPTAELIKHYVRDKGWSYDDFLVSSFDHHELKKFHVLCPQVKTGAILVGLPIDLAAFADKAQTDVAIMNKDYVSKEFVDDAHARGKQVFIYTVNTPEQLQKVKNMGINGICSDYPDIMVKDS